MKICIYGAGAIGGYLGVQLARAGGTSKLSDRRHDLQRTAISHDKTLLPGDLICCGTSVGVGVMKEPVNTVSIVIDGIGELTNEFRP